jgi:hypothetical protein
MSRTMYEKIMIVSKYYAKKILNINIYWKVDPIRNKAVSHLIREIDGKIGKKPPSDRITVPDFTEIKSQFKAEITFEESESLNDEDTRHARGVHRERYLKYKLNENTESRNMACQDVNVSHVLELKDYVPPETNGCWVFSNYKELEISIKTDKPKKSELNLRLQKIYGSYKHAKNVDEHRALLKEEQGLKERVKNYQNELPSVYIEPVGNFKRFLSPSLIKQNIPEPIFVPPKKKKLKVVRIREPTDAFKTCKAEISKTFLVEIVSKEYKLSSKAKRIAKIHLRSGFSQAKKFRRQGKLIFAKKTENREICQQRIF